MTITRKRLSFETQFTQIPNRWTRDRSIDHAARGLLGEIMSHDPEWRISQASLVHPASPGVLPVTRHAVRKMVGQLVTAGYLVRDQGRNGERFGEVNYSLADPWAKRKTVDSPVDNL